MQRKTQFKGETKSDFLALGRLRFKLNLSCVHDRWIKASRFVLFFFLSSACGVWVVLLSRRFVACSVWACFFYDAVLCFGPDSVELMRVSSDGIKNPLRATYKET